jgi:hypothetical protein
MQNILFAPLYDERLLGLLNRRQESGPYPDPRRLIEKILGDGCVGSLRYRNHLDAVG